MGLALLDTLSERKYLTTHLPTLEVPRNFRHTPPEDRPTRPAFPDTLDEDEQAEVAQWLRDRTPVALAGAVAKVAEYETFWNAKAAWDFANTVARIAQYRIALGDGIVYNNPTTARSADDTGAGSTPPPHYVGPRLDP